MSYTFTVTCISIVFCVMLVAIFRWELARPHPDECESQAVFEITSCRLQEAHFSAQWVCRGTLLFLDGSRNLPIRLKIPRKRHPKELPLGTYECNARLLDPSFGAYTLVVKETPVMVLESDSSLALRRQKSKKKLQKSLQKHIKDKNARTFLFALATGEIDDELMLFDLRRLGLLHLIAISGFHFSVLATFFGYFVRLIFNDYGGFLLQLLLLSLYFCFIGSNPSVIRAWLMVVIALAAPFLHRESTPLGSLCGAFCLHLLFEPFALFSVGFEYSYAITASIILCTKPLQTLFNTFDMPFKSLFSPALALLCAVNVCALPISIFYFGSFPLMSLFCNLFGPFLVSFCLIGLTCALFVEPLFQGLATVLFRSVDAYTAAMWSFLSALPDVLPPLTAPWLSLIFLAATLWLWTWAISLNIAHAAQIRQEL